MTLFISRCFPGRILSLTIFLFLVFLIPGNAALAEVVDLSGMYSLENGLKVQLIPETSTSVVATLVLVRSGYAAEGSRSGFSHLLEHLVFAGTNERSREEIQQEVRELGGYVNGFTRDDYTGYLIVGHRDHLPRHLDILADMLFHSTIEEKALGEAKDVVLEEIRRTRSRPGARDEELFQSLLYEGSPYAESGIGNESAVSSVTRDEVENFYKRAYRPNNMVILIRGGLKKEKMREAFMESFGAEPMGPEPVSPQKPSAPSARRSYLLGSTLPDVRVRIGFAGPDPKSEDAQVLELFLGMLGGTDGILDRALKGAGMKPRSVSASLSVKRGFSRIVLSAILPAESDPTSVQKVILEAVPAAVSAGKFPQWVARTREAMVAEAILGREKLHYYLMGIAPWIVSGSPGQGIFPGRWDEFQAEDVARAAQRYILDRPYIALLTLPESKREISGSGTDNPVRAEAMLDNGIKAVVEQRPGSPVFAMNILTRHRSAVEPEGREGIADFLHRLLPLGTYEKERNKLESELRDLGASLSAAGNPMVPFGDFYTSRLFSWIRLECLVEKREKAGALLAEMVKTPLLSPEAVEEVREQMLSFTAYNAGTPDKTASRLLAAALYGDALGPDVYGSPESISAITVEDLQTFHQEYFSGRNLIISVVSGMPVQQSIELVERLFSDLPPGEGMATEPVVLTTAPKVIETRMGKPQGAYAAGAVTGLIGKEDAVVLPVASGWLNTRVVEEMREKKGLAYSLGVSLGEVDGKAVFTFSMGTAPEKLERAREALRNEISKAREDYVSGEEILREVNALTGRLQIRMLSSINRAFYLGMAARDNLPHTFDEDYRRQLLSVRSRDVERVLDAYLPGESMVEVLVR